LCFSSKKVFNVTPTSFFRINKSVLTFFEIKKPVFQHIKYQAEIIYKKAVILVCEFEITVYICSRFESEFTEVLGKAGGRI